MKRAALISAVVAVVLVVAVIALGGDGDPRPGPLLRALQADPMASYVPPGSTTYRRRDDNAGTASGKPHGALVARDHRLPVSRAAASFAATQKAAVDAGWRFGTRPPDHSVDALGDRLAIRAERRILGDQPAVLTVILTDRIYNLKLAADERAVRVTIKAR